MDELERIIPRQNIAELQEYLLHEYGDCWAELRTNSREELIEYINRKEYEVMEIKVERNCDGQLDFRLIVRKRGNRNE